MANIYTTKGEETIVDIIDATVVPSDFYVGWGTGTSTALKADTAIETESAETRVVTTQSQPTASKNQFKGTITSASGQTIANAGIMDAISSGNLILHADFAGVALLTGDKIEFTFTLEQT